MDKPIKRLVVTAEFEDGTGMEWSLNNPDFDVEIFADPVGLEYMAHIQTLNPYTRVAPSKTSLFRVELRGRMSWDRGALIEQKLIPRPESESNGES